MKANALLVAGLCSLVAMSGCAKCAMQVASVPDAMNLSAGPDSVTDVQLERMRIWKASLSIQVWSVSNAIAETSSLVDREGGFVEQKWDEGERSARMTLRVPVKALRSALSGLEALGTVTYRSVEAEDVTEEYIDIEARLKNKIVLRDRLKQLLDKAADVKDVLAIEAELNRVQSDIDSMEGRIKSLRGRTEYATVTLDLKQKPILGPVGYLVKGFCWGVGKLFVIRN